MKDKYLVLIDDYKIANIENPILYTRDINSCIGLLLHNDEETALMHIEATYTYILLDKLNDLLKNKTFYNADIFTGPHTTIENLNTVKTILANNNIEYNEYESFRSLSNERSIGYNYLTKEYFEVSMDEGYPIFNKREIKTR